MGERRWVVGWLHLVLTILLGGALFTLGLLIALGKVEIRQVSPVSNGRSQVDGSPAGPLIETVVAADEFFHLLDQTAFCFKYEGTWIDCWIEVDVNGKKTRLGEDLGEKVRIMAQAAADKKEFGVEPSGYLVWVLRSVKDKEVWDLAINVLDQDGKAKAAYKATGIAPPQPSAAHGSGSTRSGGLLSGGREVTLATLLTYGEQGGQITRTAKLKCKAAK